MGHLCVCVSVFWMLPNILHGSLQKNYTKYCIPVKVSCDACLTCLKQTGGMEEKEVWPNRENVKGADGVLEEWRQVQLGIMNTCQENSLLFLLKHVKRWKTEAVAAIWHSLTIIMSAARLNNKEEGVSPSHTHTCMLFPGVNVDVMKWRP